MAIGGRVMLKIDKPTTEQRQAADPETSVWVSANAGSGKTHVLVDRVIRLMLDGAEPETILCLTFTKAAAAEMQTRLFQRLGSWTLASDEDLQRALEALGVKDHGAGLKARARRLFTRALETPGGLKIQTIHAFAEKLLKLFPVEAGIAPDFDVLEDRQAIELLDEARQQVLLRAASDEASDEARAMALVEPFCSADTFDELLTNLIKRRGLVQSLRQVGETLDELRQFYAKVFGLAATDTRDGIRDEALAFDRQMLDGLQAKLDRLPRHGAHFDVAVAVRNLRNGGGIEDLRYFTCKGDHTARADNNYISNDSAKADPELLIQLSGMRDTAFRHLVRHDLALRADTSSALVYLACSVHRRFADAKKSLGVHDFDDLIGLASNLLNGSASAQWVLYKLDKGLNHILVDEAQDTSPAQWRIVQALAEEFFSGAGARPIGPRTIFVVGDRKQSIYSFQGADAQSFEKVRLEFSARIKAAEQDFPDVGLRLSYRSGQTVLNFVDAVFPPASMQAMGFSASDDDGGHTANRKDQSMVQVWPVVPAIKNDEDPDPDAPVDEERATSHRKRLAGILAAAITSWIGKRKLAGTGRPVQAGDIMVLFQRRSPLFNFLIAALRHAKVEVAGADRLTLRDSIAVMDLVALGQFLLLPQDDYGLACVLKSPLVPVPLDDDDLIVLAAQREEQSLWSRLGGSEIASAKANFDYLSQLQNRRGELGVHALMTLVLSRSRKALLARLGPEALDATDAFLDHALDFELQHGPSLSAFIAWFLVDENEIKREMEQGVGQVRLLTVHGSKGLEANIVILADAADARAGKQESLVAAPEGHWAEGLPLWTLGQLTPCDMIDEWKEVAAVKAAAEHKRLLYVAMTRARNELYLCSSSTNGKAKDDSWFTYLDGKIGGNERLGAAQLVHVPWFEEAVRHYGVPHEEMAGPAEKLNATSKELGWLTISPVETGVSAALERDDEVPSDREIDRLLGGWCRTNPDDALARLLLGPDCRAEVEWAARNEFGTFRFGRVDRLLVTAERIVFVMVGDDTHLASAASAFAAAYPGREIVAGQLWLQDQRLSWM
jgi:ATP-dependent helicase/nuclease subunit A